MTDKAAAFARPQATYCLAVAMASAGLVMFFFAPRFVYWRSLEVGQWLGGAETHRAFSTFEQLRDPWAPVNSPPNLVIGWRLLFPVLWYSLHLPESLYLALPYAGCLLSLWLLAWLTYQRFADWSQTFLTTALVAALPWFFVSTGWLTYFDSWLVLGLLVVSFVPSRIALVAACLLTPWIDERFVLALPVAGLVRFAALHLTDPHLRRAGLMDAAVIAAASLPYPAIRAVAWWRGDPNSTAYMQYHWEHIRAVPWSRFLEGLWSGFRAGWLIIGAALWFAPRRMARGWGALFVVVAITSSLAALTIAADMSRSMVIGVPILILGAWLWHDTQPAVFRIALPLLLLTNLLLPAEHVLWITRVPIRYLHTQIDDYRNPPAAFQPGHYLQIGNSARQGQNRPGARAAYDVAIRLDPRFTPGYVARASLSLEERDAAAARPDVAIALALAPQHPDALFLRAVLSQVDGKTVPMVEDLRLALATAPADWAWRADALRLLEQAQNRLSPPAATPNP